MAPIQNYDEAVAYLFSKLPMFYRLGSIAYKKDVTNTLYLAKHLNNPHQAFQSIHIAGTNGKGSTSHLLAAILQAAGYKVGLYTSPHIHDFRERIRVNGQLVSEEFVINFINQTQGLVEEIKPSFFELSVLMAYSYFAKEQVDIAIVETGLGGRLDSTNIISPLLSIITNIGLDHQHILGRTLEKIAYQKAGIIKAYTPVLIGEALIETMPVFEEEALLKHAPLFTAKQLIQLKLHAKDTTTQTFEAQSKIYPKQLKLYTTSLLGAYQQNNLRTVLAATEILKQTTQLQLSDEAIAKGIAQVKSLTGFFGRWDVISNTPLTIADVGHNIDGLTTLLDQLKNEHSDKKWHFILGFVKDKAVEEVLSIFPKTATYYFMQAHIPRAMPVETLAEIASNLGLKGSTHEHIDNAFAEALKQASNDDVIMVLGSFFNLAELSAYKEFVNAS